MAIVMKIKYLDKLKEGFRFKRRFPKDVAQITGLEFFQARFAVKEDGPALLREHAALPSMKNAMSSALRVGRTESRVNKASFLIQAAPLRP